MNKITIFEGQEVRLKTDKGITLINLVCTAKSCGLVNITKGFESVRWSQVKERLSIVKKGIHKDISTQHLEEIQYIIEEIEKADDRNSIYMSSWLSQRLALECHSEKAMRYKNFLVSLDEARDNKELINPSSEINNIVGQVLSHVIPTLSEQLSQQVVPVMVEAKNQVNSMANLMHDQSVIYDQERDDLKSLIGFRSVNTKRLTAFLKEKLSELSGVDVTGNSQIYLKAKSKLFKEFKAVKWEDIPAKEYNRVHAFIDGLEEF